MKDQGIVTETFPELEHYRFTMLLTKGSKTERLFSIFEHRSNYKKLLAVAEKSRKNAKEIEVDYNITENKTRWVQESRFV